MENEVKEKTKLEIIKELWKNPKTHAIIVLGFWLIFIAVITSAVMVGRVLLMVFIFGKIALSLFVKILLAVLPRLRRIMILIVVLLGKIILRRF